MPCGPFRKLCRTDSSLLCSVVRASVWATLAPTHWPTIRCVSQSLWQCPQLKLPQIPKMPPCICLHWELLPYTQTNTGCWCSTGCGQPEPSEAGVLALRPFAELMFIQLEQWMKFYTPPARKCSKSTLPAPQPWDLAVNNPRVIAFATIIVVFLRGFGGKV